MKHIFLFSLFSCLCICAIGQLKPKTKCGTFYVDILDGKVNGVKPNAQIYDIKSTIPCFTSEEDKTAKCGAGVFYKDKDIYFYTDRNYVEIGDKFKGQLSIPLLGGKRNSFFKLLGNPKVSDDTWDAFEMAYGTLVLHYNSTGRVNKIQFATRNTNTLTLCE